VGANADRSAGTLGAPTEDRPPPAGENPQIAATRPPERTDASVKDGTIAMGRPNR